VQSFLQTAGLQQYAHAFLEQGFDEMATLLEVTDSDLRDLGLPSHHVMELRRQLQEVSGAQTLNEEHPVVAFLIDIEMIEYAEVLLVQGFGDLQTLAELNKEDMEALGIKRGHAMKLVRKLRELGELGELGASDKVESDKAVPPVATAMRSWLRVQELGTITIAARIPFHFFELAPDAMDMFPADVREKYREWTSYEGPLESQQNLFNSPGLHKIFAKIVDAVGQAVAGQQDWDVLIPTLRQLGSRHAGYGVRQDHLAAMEKALLCALRASLGEDFTREAEYTWKTSFNLMASIMHEGIRAIPVGELEVPGRGEEMEPEGDADVSSTGPGGGSLADAEAEDESPE